MLTVIFAILRTSSGAVSEGKGHFCTELQGGRAARV